MRNLIMIWLCSLCLQPLHAFHIVGGEIFYDCLGDNNYLITLKVYRDCNSDGAEFDSPLFMAIYTGDGLLHESLALDFPGSIYIDPGASDPCMLNPPDVCVEEAVYTVEVNLPSHPYGYDIVYQRCCRNSTIVNLDDPDNQGATYTTHIPDPGSDCNSSPRFNSFPPLVICAGFPFNFDHSATDPDGDSLVYILCDPYQGATPTEPAPVTPGPPPYPTVDYSYSFDATYPMEADPPLTIFTTTGWMEGTPELLGQYVVGVCVLEYRDGNLIGEHKRDFQFNVTDCTPGLYADFPDEYNNCDNWTIAFENSSFGTTEFYWDFGDLSTTADTSIVAEPVYTYPDTGTYIVMLIAKPGTSCADTAYSNVQIYPGLVAQYDYETNCAEKPVAFSDASFSTFGFLNQWEWDFGDGNNSTLQNPEHIFESGGTYDVSLSIKNIYGCTKTTSQYVTVYPKPQAHFTTQDACLDALVNLEEASWVYDPYSITSSEWILPDGSYSSGIFASFFADTSGAYPVTYWVTTNTGCSDTVTSYISIRPPVVADVYTDTTICEGDTVQLFVRNGMFYEWFPNYQISDITDHDPLVYPLASTNYTVIVSDFCTSDTATISVTVNPNPEAIAWGDTAVYRYEPIWLGASGGISYEWTPPTGLDNPLSDNPQLLPYETTYYVVTVTDENGCTDTDSVNVVVWLRCQEFTIPSAFSPNQDGVNDVFRIVSNGDDEASAYQIYNRWGECVFIASSIHDSWDGTFEGREQETGVYMYMLQVQCESYTETLAGTITLLR